MHWQNWGQDIETSALAILQVSLWAGPFSIKPNCSFNFTFQFIIGTGKACNEFPELRQRRPLAVIKTLLGKQKNTTMNFEQLVPNVYYVNIMNGLKMFADCLGFVIGHDEIKSDQPFCVLTKDGLSIYLFEHAKLAKEHNPEFRFVTNNIEEVYENVSKSHPEFLHPNLKEVTLRQWGAKEFALRDEQVCIIIQQW